MRISLSGLSLTGRLKPGLPPVALPNVALQHMQLGAATATTATVAVRGASLADNIRVRTSPNSNMAGATLTAPVTPDATSFVAKVPITGLTAGVPVYYQARINGHDVGPVASYTPLPQQSAANFKVAFGSCANPGATNDIYTRIAARNPALFMTIGDTPYIDLATNDPGALRTAYSNYYAEPTLAALLNKTQHVYTWDDHDFGANDSHSGSAAAPASKLVYREFQPHYTLNDAGAIYHAFTKGRVRFIVMDLRSERIVGTQMISAAQMTWIKGELDAVAANANLQGAVIVSSVPWIASSDADTWFGFQSQRTELGNYIVTKALQKRVLMISGDAHMIAYDDGTNNAWGGFPVFHASPLNRTNSTKGGPYSGGTFALTQNQYGVLDIADNGTTVSITCRGYNASDTELLAPVVAFQDPPAPPAVGFGDTIQSTAVHSNDAFVSSLNIPMPQAAAAGNMLVVAGAFEKDNAGFAISGAGGGWTIQENFSDGGGTTMQFAWKIATGGESGNITVSVTNSLNKPSFAFAEFGGTFDAVPAGAEVSNYSVTARTSASATLNTTAANALALAVAVNDSAKGTTFATTGAPWVTVASADGGSGASGNAALIMSKAVVAAGAHPFTATHVQSDQIALFMVEMKSGSAVTPATATAGGQSTMTANNSAQPTGVSA